MRYASDYISRLEGSDDHQLEGGESDFEEADTDSRGNPSSEQRSNLPEESAGLARTLHGQNQKANQSNLSEEEKEDIMLTNRHE